MEILLKMNRPKCFLVLRGGLGNQLFQIAAAISAVDSHEIIIWTYPGLPRTTHGIVDLQHLILPNNIQFHPGPRSRFFQRLLSANLSIGLRFQNSILLKFVGSPINSLIRIFMIVAHKCRVKVVSGEGVGYFPMKIPAGNFILNGYFQSRHWIEQPRVLSQLSTTNVQQPSSNFLKWKTKIQFENPAIMHIRLGDYKSEPNIGILDPKYFKNAIEKLYGHNIGKRIWIFTDEPESIYLDKIIPNNFEITLISDPSLSPAETFQLMRYGRAYIISNSTFSWWGAYLRLDAKSAVALPKPWFKNQISPREIAPLDWISIDDPF